MNDPVSLLSELVRIDSVNPGLVPGATGEIAIVGFLHQRLQRSGFSTLVVAPPDGFDRPSLLAWHVGTEPGPALLLNGHLDTVGVEGMASPFRPRVEGDRLYGRGAADMKGGVAGLVVAAEAIARAGRGSVALALVADEEDASLGTETVIDHLPGTGFRPDLAVIGEPTGLDRCVSLRGFAVLEVEFAGRAAHSSQPGEGVNAVAHLGRLLAAVERADAALVDGGSWSVTVVSGGSAPYTIPAAARATVERRTVPGESTRSARAELEAMLADLRAADPTLAATVRIVVGREAWKLDETGAAHTFAALLDEGLRGTPGSTGRPFEAPYWMEAPLWQDAGIPTLVCGPSGGGLHAVDEWVDLRQVRAYPTALVQAFRSFADAD